MRQERNRDTGGVLGEAGKEQRHGGGGVRTEMQGVYEVRQDRSRDTRGVCGEAGQEQRGHLHVVFCRNK